MMPETVLTEINCCDNCGTPAHLFFE
jgi:hypothetical protein